MSLSDDLRVRVGPLWEQVVRHPFVIELGDGTLPAEKFRVYFEQDYLFLKDWVKLLGLGVAKSPDFDSARSICAFLNGGLIGEEACSVRSFVIWDYRTMMLRLCSLCPRRLRMAAT